jgi:hypothetical protein
MADDREQLYQALRNADAAGDTQAAKRLAEYIQTLPTGVPNTEIDPSIPRVDVTGHYIPDQQPATPADPSLVDRVKGLGEAALSLASGATGGTLGMIGGTLGGVAGAIANGEFGTPQGMAKIEQAAGEGANALTYQPRTQLGQQYTQNVGDALNAVLPVTVMPELAAVGAGARAGRGALRDIADATNAPINASDASLAAQQAQKLRDLIKKPTSTLSGVGSAAASKDAVRVERMERLGIKPTLGQITRDPQQLKFERETAKLEEGKPINEHLAEQNAQMERNFEALADAYGPNASDLRDVGNSVIEALEAKKAERKAEIKAAYDEADAAGELGEPVDVTNLVAFAKANKGKDKIAPIISMIDSELQQNAKPVGGDLDKLTLTPTPTRYTMPLRATEDLRQAINEASEPGTPNSVWGIKAKKVLDAATEDKGGPLYRQARRQYENYANEFLNHDVVDKLLRTKPGTKDAAVVPEDVFQHTILRPRGKDDVSHIFRVLEAHPVNADPAVIAAGRQAAANLRGALVNHIRDQMFSNGGANAFGDVVGSQAKIRRAVDSLDARGKLKAVLGREGADYVRDLRDAALDIYTTPEGTVNTSNNVGPIVAAFNAAEKYAKPIPGVKQVAQGAAEIARSRAIAKRVEQALNPKPAVSGSPFNSSQKRPRGATVH